MIITGIRLKDFGRHVSVEADTNAPVLGLLGPNGSGKSTILKALEFAFTGTLPDNLDSYVRGTGEEDGPKNAIVEVSFVKNGMPGTIMRQIGKTPKRKLVWDGQEIKAAKEVDAVLGEIFNADKQAISNAIFISQGELDRLLFGTQANREQLFVKLLLLSFLEKRADLVDQRIRTISAGLTDFSALVDELLLQRKACESNFASIEGQLAQTKDWSPEIDAWREYSKLATGLKGGADLVDATKKNIRDTEATLSSKLSYHAANVQGWLPEYSDPFKLITDYERLSEKLNVQQDALSKREALATAAAQYKDATRLRDEILAEVAGYEAEADELAKKLGGTTSDSKRRLVEQQQRRDRLVQELADAQQKMLETHTTLSELLNKPEPYPKDEDRKDSIWLEDAEREVIKLETKLEVLRTAVAHVHEEQTQCPVCQNAIDASLITGEAVAKIEALYNEKQAALKARWVEVEAKLKLNREHADKVAEVRKTLSECITSMDAKASELKPIPDLDLNALQQELQETIELENARQGVLRTIPAAKSRLSNAQRILDGLTAEQLEEIKTFDETALQLLRAETAALRDKKARLQNAYAEIEALVVELGNQKTNLGNFEKLVADLTIKGDELQLKFSDELVSIVKAAPEDVEQGVAHDMFQRVTETLDQKQAAWNSLSGQLKQAEQALNGVKQRMVEMDARVSEDALRRSLVEHLKILRDTLSKSGIPMSYIRYRFSQLVELTGEHLIKLNANFAIQEDPDIPVSLLFQRLDEESGIMEQGKLSGGQRVRLSVAFLMAVQQLIIPEIGFLVLDEPSVHLDDEGVENLKDMLITLSAQLGNSESQVVICDHNTALRPAFAKFLELS